MSPITHLLVSWTVAHAADLDRRDRALVTLAGVVPDLDGAGLLVDLVRERLGTPSDLWDWHHVLAHNVAFGVLLVLLAAWLAHRRAWTVPLVALSFHLHLLGDLVGSRGPDGYQWPIPYLLPFTRAHEWIWAHQWGLKAWPNTAVTLLCLGLALRGSWSRGRSPLELVSPRADAALTGALRARFGQPA